MINGDRIMKKKRFLEIVFLLSLILLIAAVIGALPNFIGPGGRIRFNLGEFDGYKYSYEKQSRLYREPINGGEEVVVSTTCPTSKEVFFVQDDYITFSSYEREIVRVHVDTLEEVRAQGLEQSPYVIGITSSYIVTQDIRNNAYIVIYEIKDMSVKYEIDMKPSKIRVSDEYVEFIGDRDGKYYKITLADGEVDEIEAFDIE